MTQSALHMHYLNAAVFIYYISLLGLS